MSDLTDSLRASATVVADLGGTAGAFAALDSPELTGATSATAAGMTGFKEALLTKVLCVVYWSDYLTILKYTGTAGKREIARSIWGLELPDPERVTWTIGRLIIWSKDPAPSADWRWIQTQQHAAQFLWWAKDQS